MQRVICWLIINAARYIQTLLKLRRALCEKRSGKIMQPDNARPYTVRVTLKKIGNLGWELFAPSYRPDLAPSDYHLFGYVEETAARRTLWDAGGHPERSAPLSSGNWNGFLRLENFQTSRTVGKMCKNN